MPYVTLHMINGDFYHGTVPLEVLVHFKKTQVAESLKKGAGQHKTLPRRKKMNSPKRLTLPTNYLSPCNS